MKNVFKFMASLMLMVVCGAFICSCSKDDDEEVLKDVSLYVGDKYTIPGKVVAWTSSEVLIASVKDNVVTAITVGSAKISNGKNSFNVTVKPKYYSYDEPCLKWGASKSTVKSFYSSYKIEDESSDIISFAGKRKELMHMCLFKNSALNSTAVILKSVAISTDELTSYLGERYIPVTTDNDGNILFISGDQKTAVRLSVEYNSSLGIYYMVMYFQYTGEKLKVAPKNKSDFSATIFETEEPTKVEDINALNAARASMTKSFEKLMK